MKLLFLDLLPAYITFEFQSNQSDGTVYDPTGTPTVSIYEESGSDGTYDNSQISGSPFNMDKINAVTGNYGVLIDKSLFTAGKIYRVRYSATVDGIATAKIEVYFATNSTSFKADVSNLDVAVSTRSSSNEVATVDLNVDAILVDTNDIQSKLPSNYIMGSSVQTDKDDEIDSIKSTLENSTYGLSALKTLIDAIDTSTELAAKFTEIKGAGWTDETLKALKDVVDAITTENLTVIEGSA